jgi:hypothetical protein
MMAVDRLSFSRSFRIDRFHSGHIALNGHDVFVSDLRCDAPNRC